MAWHVLLTCGLLLAAAPVGLFAQSNEPLRTFWWNSRSFSIPFNTDPDPRILDVLLHVSTDKTNYRYVNAVRPTDRRFLFQAPGDGTYYFVVQTRDQAGALTPADVRSRTPDICVLVDTERPLIRELQQAPPREGPVAIQWSIEETNFAEVWADYRSTAGGPWYPLLLPPQKQGQFEWKPAVSGELELRMQTKDKAGNVSEPKTLLLKVDASVASKAPPPDQSNILHVKSRTFVLGYQIGEAGPSGVMRVEVWKMRPGMRWQKCEEHGDGTKQNVKLTVETSGRWGFRLIPRNGVGLADRDPQPGDQPDVWVEVDEKVPEVKIRNVTVTPAGDGGTLTVYWSANDTFLKAMPITIWYSLTGQGDWKPLQKDLPNTPGSWSEKTGSLPLGQQYQFYLKVSATDEAGNTGEDQWRETVKVDLKIPRIKNIEVKPNAASYDEGQQSSTLSSPRPPASGGAFTVTPASSPQPSPNNASGNKWNSPGVGIK
jgi:hypothetical protein